MNQKKARDPALHAGHRKRMQEKFFNSGASAFNDHELLEIFLYSVFLRQDTNEPAHRLLEAFGSLAGVLDANPQYLASMPGFGDRSAFLISILGELSRRYVADKVNSEKDDLAITSIDKAAVVFSPFFTGMTTERICVLFLDNSLTMTDRFCIDNGSLDSITLSVRNIVERAILRHAAGVIIAHNHPHGTLTPSTEDLNTTRMLKNALSLMGITLIEHFIFTELGYKPFLYQVENNESETDYDYTTFEIKNETSHPVDNTVTDEESDAHRMNNT